MARDASTLHRYPDALVAHVVDWLMRKRSKKRGPLFVGLSGLQGSGKSTLTAQVVAALSQANVPALALSIDDFYCGRGERARLARSVHPLFVTRGAPGTHDLALLDRTLAALREASPQHPALVPRFDKGRDTRLPRARWRKIVAAPRVIVLEGWCVGVPAQAATQLARPINALERDEDRDGRWRHYVNAQLCGDYARLWRRFDALIQLAAPSFEVVQRWRDEQERPLRRARAPRALSPAALQRFLLHYERLSRHALRELPALADLRLMLDASRRVRRIAARRAGSSGGSATPAQN